MRGERVLSSDVKYIKSLRVGVACAHGRSSGKHLGGADDTIAAINSGNLRAPLALAKENQQKKTREF